MASGTGRDPVQDTLDGEMDATESGVDAGQGKKKEEVALPLPGWLTKAYFLFPIVLYIPDAIFNYYVYSDGVATTSHDPFIQGFWSLLAVVASMNIFAFSYFASVGALMRRIGGDDTVRFRSQVRTFANLGKCSARVIPGVREAIGLKSPRIFSGASGFMSNVSMWLGPPN